MENSRRGRGKEEESVFVSSPTTRLSKHAWGSGSVRGRELVRIENGGSFLTLSLCRILLMNTTQKVMIVRAIWMKPHHLNIPSTQVFNLYNWSK